MKRRVETYFIVPSLFAREREGVKGFKDRENERDEESGNE